MARTPVNNCGSNIQRPRAPKSDSDKNLAAREREVKKHEIQVSHAERRMAAQQSLISNLEARLGELEQSNRLLKLQLSTSGPSGLGQSVPAAPVPVAPSAPYIHAQVDSPTNVALKDVKDALLRIELYNMKMGMDQLS